MSIVAPGLPGCLPGRRFPRSRSDRSAPFFLYGLSDEGGRDDVESFPAWRSSCPTLAASRSFYAVSSPISRYASASSAASSAAGSAESSSAEGTPGTLGTTGDDHHPAPPVSKPLPRVATPAPTGIFSSPQPAGQPRQRTANTPADHYLHRFRAACRSNC